MSKGIHVKVNYKTLSNVYYFVCILFTMFITFDLKIKILYNFTILLNNAFSP